MPEKQPTSIVFASLVLRGKNIIPQEVTDAIGLNPTKSFKRGDIRKGTKKWPHGYWELTSKETVQSSDLSMHLEWLAEQLEPSKSELIEIVSQGGVDAEISCFWILPTSHESISLSSELLIRIASLGLRINIDIYCLD
jgi:hypothetical protein